MDDNQGPQEYVPPQTGYVLNDAADGTIFIGSDEKVKDTVRPRQIEIHSTSNACIKLYKDGGFEIRGQSTGTSADNIISECKDGLAVSAKNIRLDAGNGEITLAARSVRFESTGTDQDFVLRSNGNLKIEAGDTLKLEGSVVAIGARTRMAIFSGGGLYINGTTVSISEPQTKLKPPTLANLETVLLKTLFPNLIG
jgi:hypothetical protein